MFDITKMAAIEDWYKAVVILGIILLVLSLSMDMQTRLVTNDGLMVFSISLLCLGFGEWRKWKCKVYTDTNGMPVNMIERKPNDGDYFLQVLGIFLLIFSIIVNFVALTK